MENRRKIIKFLGKCIVGIGIALVLGSAIALILMNLALSLFLIYCAGVTLYLLTATFGHQFHIKKDTSYGLLTAVTHASTNSLGTTDKWRSIVASRLSAICAITAWPAGVIKGAYLGLKRKGKITPQYIAVHKVINGDDITGEPLAMLVCIIVAFILFYQFDYQERYVLAFSWVVVIYCIVLCTSIIVAPIALAERARRASGSPLRRVLFLAFITIALTTLSLTIIFHSQANPLEGAIKTITKMYSQLDSVESLLKGEKVPAHEIFQGFIGALLATAVLQGIVSIKSFQRQDLDYLSIANCMLFLERPALALQSIKKVKNFTANTATTKATAQLALDQLDEALSTLKHQQRIAEGYNLDKQICIRDFVEIACFFPVPSKSLMKIFSYWLSLSPTQCEVATISMGIVGLNRAEPSEVAKAISISPDSEKHRVLIAHLHIRNNDVIQAASKIMVQEHTEDSLGYLLSVTNLQIDISGPTSMEEDYETFEKWYSENFHNLVKLQSSNLNFFESSLCLACTVIALEIADVISPQRIEALQAIFYTFSESQRSTAPNKDIIDWIQQKGPTKKWLPRPFG